MIIEILNFPIHGQGGDRLTSLYQGSLSGGKTYKEFNMAWNLCFMVYLKEWV